MPKMDVSHSTTTLLLCLSLFLCFTRSSNLVQKECGEAVMAYNVEFNKELMDEAFVNLEKGIVKSDGYYYTSSVGAVKLMAQCEGDSGTCECSECVSEAVVVAKEDCGGSISAEIYLAKCFISYVYHPGASRNNNTGKLAAIVVGGAAALLLGFIFLSLLNSRLKKGDYE